MCVECDPGIDNIMNVPFGIPLARINQEPLSPMHLELLGLAVEEGGEVAQRIGKILRWGWHADFAGTTQRDKLETELGDVLASMALLIHNGLVTRDGVLSACLAKLQRLREDALGPRQRLGYSGAPPTMPWSYK